VSEAGGPYGAERARQLRWLLWAAVGVAVLLVLAAAVLLAGGGEAARVLLVLALPGLLLLALAAASQALLARGAAAAKPVTAATGVVAILTGLLLSRTGPGLLVAVVGVPLLLVAVLPGRDEEQTGPSAG
jgi:peptidoglycan/LPS O-acetylase OafA/YrhL